MVTFEVHELDPGAITAQGVWVGPLLAIPIVDCARLSCKTARPDHVQTNLNIRGFSAHMQAGGMLNAAPATTCHGSAQEFHPEWPRDRPGGDNSQVAGAANGKVALPATRPFTNH